MFTAPDLVQHSLRAALEGYLRSVWTEYYLAQNMSQGCAAQQANRSIHAMTTSGQFENGQLAFAMQEGRRQLIAQEVTGITEINWAWIIQNDKGESRAHVAGTPTSYWNKYAPSNPVSWDYQPSVGRGRGSSIGSAPDRRLAAQLAVNAAHQAIAQQRATGCRTKETTPNKHSPSKKQPPASKKQQSPPKKLTASQLTSVNRHCGKVWKARIKDIRLLHKENTIYQGRHVAFGSKQYRNDEKSFYEGRFEAFRQKVHAGILKRVRQSFNVEQALELTVHEAIAMETIPTIEDIMGSETDSVSGRKRVSPMTGNIESHRSKRLLQARASRFSGREDDRSLGGSVSNSRGDKRLTWEEKLVLGKKKDVLVGTSVKLDKEFLRLTGPPDPAEIRPIHVLQLALPYVLERAAEREKAGNESGAWRYLDSQLRSLRQDATVQHIRTAWTMHLYEVNCRHALKHADLGQYNQAQTQLFYLFDDAINSDEIGMIENLKSNYDEFVCYRLLYLTLTEQLMDYNKLRREAVKFNKYNNEKLIGFNFAVGLSRSWVNSEYGRVMRLFARAPYKGVNSLFKLYADRLRVRLVVHLLSGAGPNGTVSIRQLVSLMSCSSSEVVSWLDGKVPEEMRDELCVMKDREVIGVKSKLRAFLEKSGELQGRKMKALG